MTHTTRETPLKFSAGILEMPAANKKAKVLTEEEHYKLVDAKLAALMNAIPEPPKKPVVRRVASPQTTDESEDEAPAQAPPKAATWSQRVSAFYKEQKSKDPAYTYKQALQEMKGK